MERKLRWEDVALWVMGAMLMVAITATVIYADHRSQLESICGNNEERAAAGILVDTSNKQFAIKCHETY